MPARLLASAVGLRVVESNGILVWGLGGGGGGVKVFNNGNLILPANRLFLAAAMRSGRSSGQRGRACKDSEQTRPHLKCTGTDPLHSYTGNHT